MPDPGMSKEEWMRRQSAGRERILAADPTLCRACTGPLYGLRVMGDRYVCSLAPIDDESDKRFAEALVAAWRRAMAGDELPPLPDELR